MPSFLGQFYEVRSGVTFVDPTRCRRCLCEDGEPTLCDSVERDCSILNPEPRTERNCRLRGRTLEDGDSVEVI